MQRYNNFLTYANKSAIFSVMGYGVWGMGYGSNTLLGGADTVFLPLQREDAPGYGAKKETGHDVCTY